MLTSEKTASEKRDSPTTQRGRCCLGGQKTLRQYLHRLGFGNNRGSAASLPLRRELVEGGRLSATCFYMRLAWYADFSGPEHACAPCPVTLTTWSPTKYRCALDPPRNTAETLPSVAKFI